MGSQRIVHFAYIYRFLQHPLVSLMGLTVFVWLIFQVVKMSQEGFSPFFYLGLLSLVAIMFIFIEGKLTLLHPNKTVNNVDSQDVWEAFTLHALSIWLCLPSQSRFIQQLIRRKDVDFALKRMLIEKKELKEEPLNKEELAQKALMVAKQQGKPYVTPLDLLAAYFLLTEEKTKLLFVKELKEEDLFAIIAWAQVRYPKELVFELPKIEPWGMGIGDWLVNGWTYETKKFTTNLTKRALHENISSTGLEEPLTQMVTILSQSKRKNVLLIGEPGVGKKALVSYFAAKSFLGDVPYDLRLKQVLQLESGLLLAGATDISMVEERLKLIIDEVTHAGNVILFLDNLELILQTNGFSLAGVLLPYLLDDKISMIGTITPSHFNQIMQQNNTFLEAFEQITLSEPSEEVVLPILEDITNTFEVKHHVYYSYEALKAATMLSHRYFPMRKLPGKAITLLDEVGGQFSEEKNRVIRKADIEAIVEHKIPVKIGQPQKDEKKLLQRLEEELEKHIVGQKEGITVISQALRRLRTQLVSSKRPSGVFLFLGPTGVGKTETAKTLAKVYFGNENAMIRIDMSEYQNQESLPLLIEHLTTAVMNNPFCLILLDEFEKANPSILDIFLSIFEDGRLTSPTGIVASFNDTIIIATSNAGSEFIREKVAQHQDLSSLKDIVVNKLEQEGVFKPELLNRFDAIVLFHPLTQDEIGYITQKMLNEIGDTLKEKDITFSYTPEAVRVISTAGFDPTMGARPLRRFIQNTVEELVTQGLLSESLKRGTKVLLTANQNTDLILIPQS